MAWAFQTILIDGDSRRGYSADCVEDTRSWQHFLIANLVEIYPI